MYSGTLSGGAFVVKFPSTWGKPFPSSDWAQRIDNQSLTCCPTSTAPSEVCLVQWQTELPWRGDFPINVAYRLRAAATGYQVVLKVTNNAPPTAGPIRIKLHLPAEVTASKLKLNNNAQSPLMVIEGNCIAIEFPTSTPVLLLQGLVDCATTTAGETSCAEVQFDFPQPECELIAGAGTVRPRVVKSGKFFVWNPFGDLPKGHLSVTKLSVAREAVI